MGISRGFSSHRPSNFSRNSLPSGSKLPEEDYLDALRAYADTMYGRMLDTAEGKQFFLDKTPAYALVLPFLTKLYPNAKYVVLTRHPLAILTSYVNSFFDGEWEVAQSHNPILERYVPALAKMVRDKPVPLAHLRYEEFVANPEAGFRTICDYLGVEFEASAIDYQESGKSFEGLGDPTGVHQHDRPVTSSVGSWAGEIAADPDTLALVRNVVDALDPADLETLGYPRDTIMAQLDEAAGKGAKPRKRKAPLKYTMQRKLLLALRKDIHENALGRALKRLRVALDVVLRE